ERADLRPRQSGGALRWWRLCRADRRLFERHQRRGRLADAVAALRAARPRAGDDDDRRGRAHAAPGGDRGPRRRGGGAATLRLDQGGGRGLLRAATRRRCLDPLGGALRARREPARRLSFGTRYATPLEGGRRPGPVALLASRGP